ncbi:tetratricopeptide repeat protein [Polaribacter sp.]|uniref:tetratricopeptide repeat protein n=1 Tax=Polaribacter sp. TaxID=1920175 RepID=UPI003EF14E37
MKKFTFLLAAMLLLASAKTNAQDDAKRDCTIKYNLFKGDYQSKKYDDAYTNWIHLMDNCKDLSVNIYKFGADLAEKIRKDPALAKRVYEQRLQYFPKDNPAKVHSDYADYLLDNKLGTDAEVFALLEKAYSIDPTKMGVKNLYVYFQGITDRNKDANPQKVFDTYDDVLENVNLKLEGYAKKLYAITEGDTAKVLDKRDAYLVRAYTVNSKALGTVEGGLDAIISGIATCERLVPLYQRDFEKNKSNSVWLKRAVSRMYNKGCQSESLYETLARAYAEAAPSPDSYTFLAGILEKNGDPTGASQMRDKAFSLETDPIKKAKYKLKFAQTAKDNGQSSKARSLAREAISLNPTYGKAYLFIARLYQSSVNSCGNDEFEKRMVYVAALNMAQRASSVDPGVSSEARSYINSYRGNIPSQKVIFTAGITPGSRYTIKCWIGETVTVPSN